LRLPLPAPPSEKGAAREDQAGEASTSDGAGDGGGHGRLYRNEIINSKYGRGQSGILDQDAADEAVGIVPADKVCNAGAGGYRAGKVNSRLSFMRPTLLSHGIGHYWSSLPKNHPATTPLIRRSWSAGQVSQSRSLCGTMLLFRAIKVATTPKPGAIVVCPNADGKAA
jgi:hypothetical protein